MSNLTQVRRLARESIRAVLLAADSAELAREHRLSVMQGDSFRAACVLELLRERAAPSGPASPPPAAHP
jgi:hypothetical protein